jgi:4-hydroxybenzoate polyprenyltransferase
LTAARTPPGRAARLSALLVASHPGPSLVIAAIIVALAVGAGATGSNLVLLALAALATELSIGWSNDFFDAPNDIAAGRRDKPAAQGAVSRRALLGAAIVALVLSAVSAFAIGLPAGLVNLAMIALGWAYNAGLKSSPLSGLLYLLGFGLIPVLSASALDGHPLPRPWPVAAAALLGLGGHFANVLPDLAGDLAQGVHGLPQLVARRFGPFAVRLAAFVLLLAASVVVVVAGRSGWLAVAALAVNVGLSAVALRAPGRIPFYLAMAVAAVDAALVVSTGSDLIAM